MTQSSGSDIPPWERESAATEPAREVAEASVPPDRAVSEREQPDLEGLASMQAAAPAADVQDQGQSSGLEAIFYNDDFFRTVLIGCAGGFGLSTLVILFALEVTTLRSSMTEHLGLWWFVVPGFTVIGFAAWTFMLIRIRRHRFTKMLRKEAFDRHQEDGSASKGHADEGDDEETTDSSQDDWL